MGGALYSQSLVLTKLLKDNIVIPVILSSGRRTDGQGYVISKWRSWDWNLNLYDSPHFIFLL